MSFVAIAIGTAVGGAALSAYSAMAQGNAQSKMMQYNSMIARQNADLTRGQMEIAKKEKKIVEAKHIKQSQKTLASQRARYSKAGVILEGTPELVATETMSEAALDAMAIRYAGTVEQSQLLAKEAGYKQSAMLSEMQGGMYKSAGYLNAGSSLLTGLGNAAIIGMGGK